MPELGAANSLGTQHMAHSANAATQFLPAGTCFKQVHFCSGIEGTTGRLWQSPEQKCEEEL